MRGNMRPVSIHKVCRLSTVRESILDKKNLRVKKFWVVIDIRKLTVVGVEKIRQ